MNVTVINKAGYRTYDKYVLVQMCCNNQKFWYLYRMSGIVSAVV